LQKRVSENLKILFPQSAPSQVKVDITNIATKFKHGLCNDIDSTIKEWNLLHRAEVIDKTSTEKFWAEISELTDAGGNKKFENI